MSLSKFYICRKCGTVLGVLTGSEQSLCCVSDIVELKANTVDAATEKHVPVITVNGNLVHVAVGSVAHPMLAIHYIQFIYLETLHGLQCKVLKPGDVPEATFVLTQGDKAVAAYEYCNLHGLWKAEI